MSLCRIGDEENFMEIHAPYLGHCPRCQQEEGLHVRIRTTVRPSGDHEIHETGACPVCRARYELTVTYEAEQ